MTAKTDCCNKYISDEAAMICMCEQTCELTICNLEYTYCTEVARCANCSDVCLRKHMEEGLCKWCHERMEEEKYDLKS